MHILGYSLLLLVSGASFAVAGEGEGEQKTGQDLVQQLQEQIQSLEARVQELETPPSEDAAPGSLLLVEPRLDGRLDEITHESPASPLMAPTRLNMSAPQDLMATVSGRWRVRGERWWDLPAPADSLVTPGVGSALPGQRDDKTLFGQSIELGLNFQVTERSRVFAEFHDGRIWGTSLKGRTSSVGTSNETITNFYLTQAFGEVRDVYGSGADVRIGRQIVELGAERQLGDDEWLLNRWSLDALRLDREFEGLGTLTFVASKLLETENVLANEFSPGFQQGTNRSNIDAELYALYFATRTDIFGEFDSYIMFLDADRAVLVDAPRVSDARLWTLGFRSAHTIADAFFWDVELATQTGRVNDERADRLAANFAFASMVGFMIPGFDYLDRAYFGFDYARGDSNPNNGNHEAYVPLKPSYHGWFGIMNLVSWQNVLHFRAGTDFNVGDGRLGASYHFLNRDTADSGNIGYNAELMPTGHSKDIGQELDITYTHPCSENSTVDLGVGHFFPGDAFSAPFGNRGITFAYAQYGIGF